MKKYYSKLTSNSGVNVFFDTAVKSCALEDIKDIETVKNIIGTDLYVNDQINKYIDRSSLLTDSKVIHKRNKLENENLKHEELRDSGNDRKHKVKDKSKDKNKINGRNKDYKYELKDKNDYCKSELKDRSEHHKDELKGRKHRKDKAKDKCNDKYERKHKELKYNLKDNYIDHNSKIKHENQDHKCILKDHHEKSKSSTKDNDSKMKRDCSKSERSESKYRGSEIASATDDGHQEKERKHKCKSSERRKHTKKTIIVENPERQFELEIQKEDRITTEKERKCNRNSEKKSKGRSSKHGEKIDENSTQRKNIAFDDNSDEILTQMEIVKEARKSSRKRVRKNIEAIDDSVMNDSLYRRNFKSNPLSSSGNHTDVTENDVMGKTGVKTKKNKIFKDSKKNQNNYDNIECKEDDNYVKKSVHKVSVQDIYKMENMTKYEMDMKKRLLKKMESNRKRTQISLIGNSSLSTYDEEHNERMDISSPEELPYNGTIKLSNLSDFETKHKKITQKRKIHSDSSNSFDNIESNIVSKSTRMLISSNVEENILHDNFSKTSQLFVEEKNENNNRVFDKGTINTNKYKKNNREKKLVSFATNCELISLNSSYNSSEKMDPPKNLKKILHNLSNYKINKVGLNKKRNMFNKKSWQYSSKLLKLCRNKSISFGNERNLYQSIKKKPKIEEKVGTGVISNNLTWSFKNKVNLCNILLKESSKLIKDEVCKKELELKDPYPGLIAKQRSDPITSENDNMGINDMKLRSYDINLNPLLLNNKLQMKSTSNINTKEIHEKPSILPENSNQYNCNPQTVFNFPHKYECNNLKFNNDNTMVNPNDRNKFSSEYNFGNEENLLNLKFHHKDHNNGCSFPDWQSEDKAGSVCENIKMDLPEKRFKNCSQSFLKHEGPFFKKIDRNNNTKNNYFRRNIGARVYRENDYDFNLTNKAKNNKFLKQKRVWKNKSFGKIVNGSPFYQIHSRNMKSPDYIRCLNNDCTDQMLPYETRKEVADSMKTFNGFFSEDNLIHCNYDVGENSAKVIIKNPHKSMLEIKFSDKLSINVSGNEIKVEKFGNKDMLKSQLTILKNNFILDNEGKTGPDVKLNTSVEKGTTTENEISSDLKLNNNSKGAKEHKTFADKSSWTDNDLVPLKVRESNSGRLTEDKNGNKTDGHSGAESSTNCMVDVGTDCLPYNTASTCMESKEANWAKRSDREVNCSTSNHPSSVKTSKIPPNEKATFIEYNMPENQFKNESKNLLKTMEIINNKEEINKVKQDVGTQYDVMSITCLANTSQKSTTIMGKSNIFNVREGINYNKPTFGMIDDNLSASINTNRCNINSNIDENLGIINKEVMDTFNLGTIETSLTEEEICKRIVLSNVRKCVELSAPNIPDKCKNSIKNETSDRNMFTYLVKKIKTLINIVSGKFKIEVPPKLNQQSKSKKTLNNPMKIRSCISFTNKQKYRVNSDCLNNEENTNLENKMQNSENKLVNKENMEKNNSVEGLQTDPSPNFKDLIIDAVEKFLISNLEFLPTNVEPFQILINNEQKNVDNLNQFQSFRNKAIGINSTTFSNKGHNNICLISNKRMQNKDKLTFSSSTTMIKRFFGKDKRKKFDVDYEISQIKRISPEKVETTK